MFRNILSGVDERPPRDPDGTFVGRAFGITQRFRAKFISDIYTYNRKAAII